MNNRSLVFCGALGAESSSETDFCERRYSILFRENSREEGRGCRGFPLVQEFYKSSSQP